MNRKQRREVMRKIQAEDLSLEVVHRDAAGIDIGNQSHYVAVPSTRDSAPGTLLWLHHSRAKTDRRLAEAVRDSHRRSAIHGRVLDRGL
jgi:hypothetical protein